MKRLISVILVVVFAVLAMAIPAQAQSRARRYHGDYSRYDRGTVQCRYDRYGRPYGCRRINRAGSVGPFIAGAVIGGVVGAVVASRRNERQPVQATTPYPQPANQQVVYETPVETNNASVIQQTPVAGPAANGSGGQFELSNHTRVFVEAYDGEKYIGRMAPGATLAVGPPKDRYRGFALVPQPDGRLANDELGREVSPAGWIFVEPMKAQGGK